MSTTVSNPASTQTQSAPPPLATRAGAWLKANLFNSWLSIATTLGLLYVIVRVLLAFVDWAFVHAVWSVPYSPQGIADTAVCHNVKGDGACWAIIADKYRLILFGRFPYDEQWRPAVVVCLFVGLYICSAIRKFWGRGIATKPVILVVITAAAATLIDDLVFLMIDIVSSLMGRPYAEPPALLSGLMLYIDLTGRYVFMVATTIAWPMVGVWVITLAAIGVLMSGGVFGLSAVAVDYWGGLPITLILATFGIAVAFPLSILIALGRRSTKMPAVRMLCVLYVELIRGVPLISVLFMASVMFPLFMPPGINVDKLLRAQIAVILFAAAYLAEVVRGGLQALPKGQTEAADALGLAYWQKTGLIILPQALRLVIPPLVNTFIGFFKDTSLVLIIGLFDLLTMGKIALSDPPWQAFSTEVYITLAIIYIMFCYAMSRYSRGLERELNSSQQR
jgi:His/Glu/Gln/Arg/opine family amino acid ABC transporter permease subunit